MSGPFVCQAVYEDSALFLMGRGKASTGDYMLQANIEAIDLKVYEQGKPGTLIDEQTITPAEVIFDTLQTDARWTKDSTGYNFRYQTLVAQLPHGKRTYVFEFKFTPAGNGPIFHAVFHVPTLELMRS
jgi:hypothetical protein